jgi:excisionase family DNA binding protein
VVLVYLCAGVAGAQCPLRLLFSIDGEIWVAVSFASSSPKCPTVKVANNWRRRCGVEDISSWLTKEEAVAATGWKMRSLERFMEKGLIQRATRSVPGVRPVTVLNPNDIKKLQEEQERATAKAPTVLKTQPRNPTRDVTAPLTANGSPHRLSPAARPTLALPPPADSSPRLPLSELKEKYYLTLAEAAQLSGLPKTYLRRAIGEGRLPGVKVAGWRIHRDDLLAHRVASE